MRPKELKFDISKIDEMESKLADIAAELEQYKKDILESLDTLKNDWNTAAGKDFMSTVNTDWTVEVDKYINIIKGVESLLKEASKQYATIEDEIDKLKFYEV